MWAARTLILSCFATGGSVTLCETSPFRSHAIRAASTISQASPSTERHTSDSSIFSSRHASLSTKKEANPGALQGATEKQGKARSKSSKGRGKTTGSLSFAGKDNGPKGATRTNTQLGGHTNTRKDKLEVEFRVTPSIEDDGPNKTDSTQVAKEEASDRNELSSAQDALRSYFSRSKKSAGQPALASAGPGSSLEADHYQHDDKNVEAPPTSQMVDHDQASAPDTTADISPPRKFTRPMLAEIQSAEMDQFVGLYQSRTAWNPRIDYALMQDGPERESFLRTSLAQGAQPYIVVILDGDNLLFDPRHMKKGYEGGKFVYDELLERIAKKHRLIPQRLDLRIRVFCALFPLSTVLARRQVVSRPVFLEFFQGLTGASLHNYVVNVGRGDQAADLRVKAALADALKDQRCFRAYLGGLDDFGYKEELNAIQEMGLLESKVHLIQVPGYAVESNAYRNYAHRAIDLDYLFTTQKAALYGMDRYVSSTPAGCGRAKNLGLERVSFSRLVKMLDFD